MNYQHMLGHIMLITLVIHDPCAVGPVILLAQVTEAQVVGGAHDRCAVGILLIDLERVLGLVAVFDHRVLDVEPPHDVVDIHPC